MDKPTQARKNRLKGSNNQLKSKQYMIKNPRIYGFLPASHVCIVRSGLGSKDFFSTVYGTVMRVRAPEKAHVDWDGNKVKKVNIKPGVYEDKLEAGFDIISTPYPSKLFPNFTYWVQVKSNRLPTQEYINALREIPCQDYVKKELHIWHDGNNKMPEIIKLN
jgi:hypothetical protein